MLYYIHLVPWLSLSYSTRSLSVLQMRGSGSRPSNEAAWVVIFNFGCNLMKSLYAVISMQKLNLGTTHQVSCLQLNT